MAIEPGHDQGPTQKPAKGWNRNGTIGWVLALAVLALLAAVQILNHWAMHPDRLGR